MTKTMGSKRKEKMSEIVSTEEHVDHIHGSLFSQSIKKFCYDSDSNSHHHAKKNNNQNSNSNKSCKVITNPLLLEDLRFHIFTFVPVNCLINSVRYVCKSWAETIASSRFAEACERRGAHSKLDLYVENNMTLGCSYFLEIQNYVSGQFQRTNLGTPLRMGYIIGTCDGMLLLRNSSDQFFFVNPLLKCWLRLPHYPVSLQRPTVFKYQGTIARVPGSSKFKLFLADCIEILGVFWYVLHVLRIGKDNSWKEIFRKESSLQRHFKCQTLYSGGDDLYWITKEVVFFIDVDKELIVRECQLSYEPDCPDQIYLLMGDRLSCIDSNDFDTTFQIYVLNFDSGKLSFHHEMGPFNFVAICGHKVYSSLIFRFWINNQIIFQVYVLPTNQFSGYEKMHFGYNIKTGQLTKIGDIDMGDFEVWLHTNSLISLSDTLL